MASRQEPLLDPPPGLRRRRWCQGPGCGRELTDQVSRMRGYGPECDPEPRNRHERRDVDQDPIPGL
ncbi:DUF6011 domain-containing protein [Streptomyces scabiei]|uniref:DUF6011 domain-containing protein n=1 Tax=Streptomyces scabiei TaxID=1930 RepID=UPI0029BCE385|nr:DUF6011 domain-containing protein [Streptomyces scabiei]MDX3283985.1 DUF6011 domain-containing protein [Streptomyces scabiei]